MGVNHASDMNGFKGIPVVSSREQTHIDVDKHTHRHLREGKNHSG